MPNKKYYQGIMFSKDIEEISKMTAIKISKRLDKISNPFEPIADTTVKEILKAFLKNPNSETYEIKSQALCCSSNSFDSKMKIVSNIYKSYWDKEREVKIIYKESNPYEYYTICKDSFKKHILRGNMYIIQEEIKLPVCLSLEGEYKLNNSYINYMNTCEYTCEYIDYIYRYSDGSVLTIRDNEIINFYDNKKNYHNFFIGKPVDNSILINNVYNYSILMVCFMAGGKEDMNPVFDSDKNTVYINYTTETGRIANCIYSNEEDDPLFNKDFLSACIYWGKRCAHPQNVTKWLEECLDRYNKIKRYYYKEKV